MPTDVIAPDTHPTASRPETRPFDFRRPDPLSDDGLRTLRMIHEAFAARASAVLSSTLRTTVSMTVAGIDASPFGDHLGDLPPIAHLSYLSLDPLAGAGLLHLPLPTALLLVDLLLGGQGRPVAERVLTGIEAALVRTVLDRALEDLAGAFGEVHALRPAITGSETDPAFAQLVAPTEVVVVVRLALSIETPDPTGAATLSICYPVAALQPVLEATVGGPPATVEAPTAPGDRHAMAAKLAGVPVELHVRFEPRLLSAEEVADLRPGDVVVLSHPADAPLTASIGDVPMYCVQPARRGPRLAVQVTGRHAAAPPDFAPPETRVPAGREFDR